MDYEINVDAQCNGCRIMTHHQCVDVHYKPCFQYCFLCHWGGSPQRKCRLTGDPLRLAARRSSYLLSCFHHRLNEWKKLTFCILLYSPTLHTSTMHKPHSTSFFHKSIQSAILWDCQLLIASNHLNKCRSLMSNFRVTSHFLVYLCIIWYPPHPCFLESNT